VDLSGRVEVYIRKNHLIRGKEEVCVALSGGADSVTLLLVLRELGCRVSAVHVNHQLRGAESAGDEAFVRQLCEKYRVPLYVYAFDVKKLSQETKTGTEEAGRMARHRAFLDCVQRHGASAIAVAHHANDLAETFLFHAARGSSLKGLAGIRPEQEIMIRPFDRDIAGEDDLFSLSGSFREIRPLLCVSRKEIEAFLSERGQSYRTDSTNFIPDGARNRIRCEILPCFECEINAETVRHISEAAGDIAAADDFLRQEAARRAEGLVRPCGDNAFSVAEQLTEEPEILQGYILMDALTQAAGRAKDIGRMHVDQVRQLFSMRSGSRISLPYGLTAVRDYTGVTLMPAGWTDPSADDAVFINGSGTYTWHGWRFRCDILPAETVRSQIGQFRYTKFLNYDKIKQNLCIRKRLNGDRIHTGTSGTEGPGKKLSDYMINEKIPARERDDVPLLAADHHIYWAVGYRISTESRVTEETSQVLRITAEYSSPEAGTAHAGGRIVPEDDRPVQYTQQYREKTAASEGENMGESVSVLIDQDKLEERIAELGRQISRDYAGKSLHMICILKGGVMFMCELAKHVTIPMTMDFMCCSSYGGGTVSKGIVKIVKDLDEPIEGRDVLVVEDIVDTGRTLSHLFKILNERKPASVRLCTLLDKPERRVVDDVHVNYTGFQVEDEFVVGYGLDYDQRYRNLPYIGVIHFDD
jgi:hypoxanthine phosphoribosyltransferase